MYYNYVFRVSHSLISTKHLTFAFMIARLPTEFHKSIGIMHQILNVAEYSHVFVIDDLFDDSEVWEKSIPSKLVDFGVKFHAYPIVKFEIRTVTRSSQSRASIGRCLSMRASDNELQRLNISKTKPMRRNKLWDSFGSRKNKLVTTAQNRGGEHSKFCFN